MFDGPFLWFLNRATGLVLLLLLTLAVVLGLGTSVARAGRGVPRFVGQHLHRNVGLLSVALLAVHITAAVADTFVTIHWWEAFVPFVGEYKPVWVGLGALGLDLLVAVAVTSAVRTRLPEPLWRGVHLLTYVAWGISVVHGVGVGTDTAALWSRGLYFGAVGAVGLSWLGRQASALVAGRGR